MKKHYKKNHQVISGQTLSKQYPHKCIKCKVDYSDSDIDDYLCENCNQARLVIAREVDAKVGSTVGQQPNSELTAYNAICMAQGGKWPVMKADGSLDFIPTTK